MFSNTAEAMPARRRNASMRRTSAVFAVALALASCARGPSPEAATRRPVAAVGIAPERASLPVGSTLRLAVTLADRAGNRLIHRAAAPLSGPSGTKRPTIADRKGRGGRPVSWMSTRPSIVAVDAAGKISALTAGTATIAARSEGVSATTTITVVSPPDSDLYVAPSSVTLHVGEKLQLAAVQRKSSAEPPTALAKWSSDRPKVAVAKGGGRVTALAPGTAVITANLGGHQGRAVIDVRPVGVIHGLDFPGSAGVQTTMRFEFTSPLPAYPATYIWRAYPREQDSYYTAFFWGNNGAFYAGQTYYGFDPYPDWSTDHAHFWEIAAPPGKDVVSGSHVVYDRWYIQVAVCREHGSTTSYDFYWDWPDMTKKLHYSVDEKAPPPIPVLAIGDAPWNGGHEVWDGILRGFQFYDAALNEEQIAREIASPGSVRQPWYLNVDPTPDDIADESGNGNDPHWVGSERPAVWSGIVDANAIRTTAPAR